MAFRNEHSRQIYSIFSKIKLNSEGVDNFIKDQESTLHILNDLGQAVFICNYKTGNYHYFNDAFLELLSISQKTIIESGMNAFFDLISDQDMGRVLYLLDRSFKFIIQLPESKRRKAQAILFYRMRKSSNEIQWVIHTSHIYQTKQMALVELTFISRLADSEALHLYPDHCHINMGNKCKFIFPPREKTGKGMVALSSRETEVLYWTKLGYLVKDIAIKLNITESGIRFHRRNILKKLGKRNFIGLVPE